MRHLLLLLLLLPGLATADEVDRLLREHRVAEAVPAARRAAEASPGDIALQERWIDLMLGLRLPDPALAHYTERARLHPTDPDAHYLVGRAAPDAAASLAAYERALRLDPDHARSYMGLGALERAAGRPRDAAALYQRALRLDPSLAEAWGGLLAATLLSEDRAVALQVARAAVKQVPDLAEPWLAIATLAPGEARSVLEQAARRLPHDGRVQAGWAEQLLLSGDAQEALRVATRARNLDPLDKRAILAHLHARAMAAGTLDADGHRRILEAGRAPDAAAARAAWDSLVASYPRCPLPLLGRAGVRVADDADGARADLERALALDGSNDEALAALGLLLVDREPARAAELLERALAARPVDGTLALAAARAHRAAGDLPTALTRIAEAARTHPLNLEIAVVHVEMLSSAGQHAEALRVARTAAERIPDLRMELAVAAAATEGGRWLDAAELYERLAERTGQEVFRETATNLRRRAAR